MHCMFGGVCAAASTLLVAAKAKLKSYDKNRGGGTQHARLIILILFNCL